jgi:DNA-binding transcriptional regulator YiaG
MTRKKTPSIGDQLAAAAPALKAWGRGEMRLRTTIATKDGGRHTEDLTRAELDAKRAAAEAFRNIRAELGVSQPLFASLLRSTPAAVRQWEQGRRKIPDPVLALAQLVRDPVVRAKLETLPAVGVSPILKGIGGIGAEAARVMAGGANLVAQGIRPAKSKASAAAKPLAPRAGLVRNSGTKKRVTA